MANFKNLDKIAPEARAIIQHYAEKLLNIFPGKIEGIFIYGSLVSGEWRKATSDINILVIVDEINITLLEPCRALIKKGLKQKITTPLFLTKDYILASLDTFPLEFLELKENHILIYGEDILSPLEISKDKLRLELEHQLKASLIRLRQVYLEIGLKRKGLERFTKSVVSDLMPVFRNLLRLKGIDPPPILKEEIAHKLAQEFNIEAQVLIDILEDKRDDERIKGKKIEYYLSGLEKILAQLSEIADKII